MQNRIARDKENCLKQEQYIRSIIKPNKKYAVVDLGWKGSTIEFLETNFPDSGFKGFYVSKHQSKIRTIECYMGRVRILKYVGFTEYMEILFSAPHPMVIDCYIEEGAVKTKYDQSNMALPVVQLHQSLKEALPPLDYFARPLASKRQIKYKRFRNAYLFRLKFVFPGKEMLFLFTNLCHAPGAANQYFQVLVHANWRRDSSRVLMILWNFYFLIIAPDVAIRKRISQARVIACNIIRHVWEKRRKMDAQ